MTMEWDFDEQSNEAKPKQENRKIENFDTRLNIADNWMMLNINLIKEYKYELCKIHLESFDEEGPKSSCLEQWLQSSDYVGVTIADVKENAFVNKRGFNYGFPFFWKNVLVGEEDFGANAWFEGWEAYKIEKLKSNDEIKWYKVIHTWILEHAIAPVEKELGVYLDEEVKADSIDHISNESYEIHCAQILRDAGWHVYFEHSLASDNESKYIIAYIEYFKICIWCQNSNSPISKKAVQEAIDGRDFYYCTHAVVVSSMGFTELAQKLADSEIVFLINHCEIANLASFV